MSGHEDRDRWETQLKATRTIRKVFPESPFVESSLDELQNCYQRIQSDVLICSMRTVEESSCGLFGRRNRRSRSFSLWITTRPKMAHGFLNHLERRHEKEHISESIQKLGDDLRAVVQVYRQWVSAYLNEQHQEYIHLLDEIVAVLVDDSLSHRHVVTADSVREITGLVGSHPAVEGKVYSLSYLDFQSRLSNFHSEDVPRFQEYVHAKT